MYIILYIRKVRGSTGCKTLRVFVERPDVASGNFMANLANSKPWTTAMFMEAIWMIYVLKYRFAVAMFNCQRVNANVDVETPCFSYRTRM